MPVALDLKLSLKNHGWVYLAPWELDNDDLLRVENICGEKLRIKIKQLNKDDYFCIGEITSDGQFKILESTNAPVLPQAWNQFEPSSKGYACDWTNPRKGEKYRL